MSITFRSLVPEDVGQLDEAQRIMAREDFAFVFDYEPGEDFDAFLERLEEKRLGIRLPPDLVAGTFEVGLLDGRIAARLSVRHELNDFLLEQGGHIGYGVLPEFRGRGLGTACLRRGLEIASDLGIARVLVTCDEDNASSRHIIEKAGGRYESSHVGVDDAVPVRRYWFEPAS